MDQAFAAHNPRNFDSVSPANRALFSDAQLGTVARTAMIKDGQYCIGGIVGPWAYTQWSVKMAKMRRRIERDYQDLKQEFGLGHYEGRGWHGFHHHATLSIAAYGFLMTQRLRIGCAHDSKKTSSNGRHLPFPRITSLAAVQRAQRQCLIPSRRCVFFSDFISCADVLSLPSFTIRALAIKPEQLAF